MSGRNDGIGERVVYDLPGMNEIHEQRNIQYKISYEEELTFDIYFPQEFRSRQLLPAIIFIQSDKPDEKGKDGGQLISWSQIVASSGFIGVTFKHRTVGKHLKKMYEVEEDIFDLIGYLRSHSNDLGINPDCLCLWAFSTGTPYISKFVRNPPTYIRCIVVFYGLMSLESYQKELPEWLETSIKEELKVLKDFSFVESLNECKGQLPPLLVVKAELDHPDINDGIEKFVQLAKKRGDPVGLIGHPEGHHKFDVLDDSQLTREIIRATLEFTKEHLKNPVSMES